MKLQVSSSYGTGCGIKSSFDKALKKLGIHNYNIVEYSSIIPENTKIVEVDEFDLDLSYGHPCAVVMDKYTVPPDKDESAFSELSYIKNNRGGGIFLEGCGSPVKSKEIDDLCNNRPSFEWDDKHSSITCEYKSENEYVTSISVALFGGIETVSHI